MKRLLTGVFGFITLPFKPLGMIEESAGNTLVERNEMVEKTKKVAKETLGYLGMVGLWGLTAGVVGFAAGYGIKKGARAAETGRITVGADNGEGGSMTTAQAGARGGQARQRAA